MTPQSLIDNDTLLHSSKKKQDSLLNFDFCLICHCCLRLTRLVMCMTLLFYISSYISDARDRAHAGEPPHRWRIHVEAVQGISYTTKITFVDRDTVLIRLYRTGDPTLLAERMFKEHGVDLSWTKYELIYDTTDESFLGGGIELPPTRLDWLLAKLPLHPKSHNDNGKFFFSVDKKIGIFPCISIFSQCAVAACIDCHGGCA